MTDTKNNDFTISKQSFEKYKKKTNTYLISLSVTYAIVILFTILISVIKIEWFNKTRYIAFLSVGALWIILSTISLFVNSYLLWNKVIGKNISYIYCKLFLSTLKERHKMMNYLRLAWIKENNIKVEYNQQYELFKKDLSQIIDTLKQNNLDLVYDQRINLILNGNHDYFWNNKFDLFIHKQGFESFRKVLLENFDIVELKPNSGYLASYIINIPYSANTFTINIKVLTSDNTINFEDTNFKLESYSDYFLNILKEYSLKTEIKNPNDQVDAIYDISLLNESAMSNKIDINVLNDFANKYCTNLEEIYFNLLKICNYILDLTNLRNIFKLRGQYDYQHSS